MRFKLLGTEIYVSFLFTAVIALMLATDKSGLALPTLFAIVCHEMGHLFTMWLLESNPKSIRLIPASVQITRPVCKTYKNDIIIALMGPFVNLLLFLVLYVNYGFFKNETILYYSLINLIIALFNLLPVKGLDGGTVLFSIVAKKGDLNRASLTVKIVSIILGALSLIVAITLALRGKINVSAFIVAVYIFVSAIIKI